MLREIEPAFNGAPAGIASRLRSPVARACGRRQAPADKLIQGVLDAGYALEFSGGVWPSTHLDDRPLGGDAQAQAWTRSAIAEMLGCGALVQTLRFLEYFDEVQIMLGLHAASLFPSRRQRTTSQQTVPPAFFLPNKCRT